MSFVYHLILLENPEELKFLVHVLDILQLMPHQKHTHDQTNAFLNTS